MKVQLAPRAVSSSGRSRCMVRASLPFIIPRSYHAPRAHRVANGEVHHFGEWYWVAFSLWCGSSQFLAHRTERGGIKGGVLVAEPPDGVPVCGTCEGRAIGAGLPPTAVLVMPGRSLLFTPRRP